MIRHEAQKSDPAEIARAVAILFPAGDVVEVRCPRGKQTTGGYFSDHALLGREAATVGNTNVYITLNQVDPALLSRRANRLDYADSTTADHNIVSRRWLLIDCDCQRPAGISATDEEHEAAILKAREIGKARVRAGWPKPVLADSGNGAHLLFRVDLPNDDDATRLVKRTLAQLGADFDDDDVCSPCVKVDQTVYNASRITKCYGTVARKGDHTADRPHRLSKLLFTPEAIEVVSREQLELYAGAEPPAPEPKRHQSNGHADQFDLRAFVARHLKVRSEGPYTNSNGAVHRWRIETCPLCGESDNSAVVVQFGDGRIGYRCHHNRCLGKGWADLRERFEPRYRARKEQHQPRDRGVDRGDDRPAAKAEKRAEVLPYRPFPCEVLPAAVGDYVRAASAAIGCDPCFIALPMLACLARAIGNKRVIQLKKTWKEPAVIWAAIIGKSGTQKTPALQAAIQFLQRRQSAEITKYEESRATWEQDKAIYDRDYAAWKRSKKADEPPPWPPVEPVCERFVTTDITIEALADRLASQFAGVLVPRDELAGWLGGIAEYKGGKGSDLGHWLATWSAAPLTVDRKTGAKKFLHVPRAAVSIVGGIQPGVLQRAIGYEHLQDGLCARLLVAMPETKPIRWTEATVDRATERAMEDVIDRLLALEPGGDEEGHPAPFALVLTGEAKQAWIHYYDRHRQEQADLDDDLAAAWSKLEAYTARFALIFHLVSADSAISVEAMQSAIRLSDWFGHEARRVYGLFGETEEDRADRELIELIRRLSDPVNGITPNDLRRRSRRFATSEDAEQSLASLVSVGIGEWHSPSPGKGGRPTRYFRLVSVVSVSDTPANPEENEGLGYGYNGDGRKNNTPPGTEREEVEAGDWEPGEEVIEI